jgi:hypothetical protein
MKIQHTTLLSAALLSATALIAAPVAGAKAKKPEPDLALQRITISPHFVVVKPNGKTSPITVRLSIRNIGHAPAGASVTLVRLLQGTHTVAEDRIPLARLAPGHASTQIAIFRDAEPQLGLLRAGAKADHNNVVHGDPDNDIKATPEIPAIAQRWTGVMEADVETPGIFGATENDRATTPQELLFTFSRLDGSHRFVYTVGGEVDQRAIFSGGGCSGEGDGSAAMPRWGGDSGLFISRDLTRYEATVRASLGSPFTVTVTCPNRPPPPPTTVKLKDLLTLTGPGGGPVSMAPKARVLSNHGHLGTIITIDYDWTLTADVP